MPTNFDVTGSLGDYLKKNFSGMQVNPNATTLNKQPGLMPKQSGTPGVSFNPTKAASGLTYDSMTPAYKGMLAGAGTGASAPLGSTDRTNQLLQQASKQTGLNAPTFGTNNNPQVLGQTTTLPPVSPVSTASNTNTNTPPPAPTYQTMTPNPSPANNFAPPTPPASFPGLIGSLATKSAQPSQDYTDIQAKIAENLAKQKQLTEDYAQKDKNIQGTAGFLTQATGLEGLLNRQYGLGQTALGQEYSGLSSQLGAANTQQQLQQQGLTSAAGLAQPVGQFGMLTNPQTGQPLDTKIFQSAIQQAQQLVNSGTPVNDPSIQSLLSPFGFVGPLAFNQAMQAQQGGGWNPAAQSGAAEQSINQGTQTQGQAYALNLGLQQLKTIQPVIQNFLSTAGINPTDVPAMNSAIGTYIANLRNPAATLQYQYMLNDLQKFASQMLAAGAGGTPTGTQAATDLMNPQNLSMNQIQAALNTLDTLGTNQVAVLQQQASASLGGTTGYAGNPATASTSTPVAPQNPAAAGLKSNPAVEAAAGTVMDVWSKISSTAGAISSLLTYLATKL